MAGFMKCLIFQKPYVEQIIQGNKTLEIWGSRTKIRGAVIGTGPADAGRRIARIAGRFHQAMAEEGHVGRILDRRDHWWGMTWRE